MCVAQYILSLYFLEKNKWKKTFNLRFLANTERAKE